MRTRSDEPTAAVWDIYYQRGAIPWRSAGLSDITRRLLVTYAAGSRLLEIGCGVGDDGGSIVSLGFDYVGLDISEVAIRAAKTRYDGEAWKFVQADFFKWSPASEFDVVYDKGVFHGLAGGRRRRTFGRRVAALLASGGIWITVCGSADQWNEDSTHGAIYLRDLVGPAEIYFEVLEIVKGKYGLSEGKGEFNAWYSAFRRR